MKYIIGISSLNRDSTTSLITIDGRLLAVVSEDRFTRIKQQGGFPHRGMEYIFKEFSLSPDDVESVCYSFMSWQDERDAMSMSTEIDRNGHRKGIFDPFGGYLHRRLYKRWNDEGVASHRRYNGELIEQRFIEPPGNNALETYHRVLEIEPGNSDALSGKEQIFQHYLTTADKFTRCVGSGVGTARDRPRRGRPRSIEREARH